MKRWYDNPDDAAREDKRNTAYGETMIAYKGKLMRMAVIKKSSMQPYIAFPSAPGIILRKATTAETDSVKRWQAYQPKNR